jgi:hypothetical protein
MSYEPPNFDPSDDGPVTGPYQPPGQQDDVVELRLGRASGARRLAIGTAVAVVALLGGAGVAYAASGSGATPAAAGASPSPSASAKAPAPPPSAHCRMSVHGSAKTSTKCPPFGRFPFRPFGFGPGGPGGIGGIGFPLGAGGAVHGQFVVPKTGGGYQTVDVQRGKVTAVSSTSLTVKSADGFSATYAVSSSTIVDAQRDEIGSVKDGNQVYVTATVSGSAATATSVSDLSLLKSKGGPFGFSWNSSSNTSSIPS